MENKTSKYFKYAIGEIILVVIGILIALQINNWNEERKHKASRNAFTKSLLLELKKDSVQLVETLNLLDIKINMLKDIKQRINASMATIDTLDFIMKYEYDPSFGGNISLNKNTFSTLVSNGQITLFNNINADQIHGYYQLVLETENIQEGQLNFYRDTFSKYLENVPTADSMENYPLLNPGKIKDQIWKGVDMEAARLQFGGITTLQHHIFLTFRKMNSSVFEANQKLINYLKVDSQ